MGETPRLLLSGVINGISYGSMLFLVAVGLTLVYGVLRVLNVTHGSFYALGAFTAASAWLAVEALGVSPFWIYPAMVVSAICVGIAVGPLLERVLLRWITDVEPLAQRENLQLLATYAIFLMLENLQRLVWGSDPYFTGAALQLMGLSEIGGMVYPNYKLIMPAIALIALFGLHFYLKKTISGKFITAVATDPEVSMTLGINVGWIYTVAFTIGVTLAALGGAFASPTIGVTNGIGAEMMVLSFAVVAVAGMGQIGGAAVAALIIGIAHSLAVFFFAELSSVVPYLIMLAVLLVRPHGLFGSPAARKI